MLATPNIMSPYPQVEIQSQCEDSEVLQADLHRIPLSFGSDTGRNQTLTPT